MKKRYASAIQYLLINVCVTAFVAVPFALLFKEDASFLSAFLAFFEMMFLYFGGHSVISAFLIAFTKLTDDDSRSYGMGFYYGTIFLFTILSNNVAIDKLFALELSAVIVGLICYIFWLKNKRE